MRDDSLGRKGSSENRNVIWKTVNWLKISDFSPELLRHCEENE